LAAEHCVVKWKASAVSRKLERLERVVESAMKQAGRSFRPRVRELATPAEALARFLESAGEAATAYVADEDPEAPPPRLPDRARSPRLVLVGPEGGFSAREKSDLDAAGAVAFTLGPYRLRAETAAVVAVYTLNRGMS
jgi:16S rRNA (uracil1498-N3)-methyltransferase